MENGSAGRSFEKEGLCGPQYGKNMPHLAPNWAIFDHFWSCNDLNLQFCRFKIELRAA
jgi:hypothetical protein